MTLCAAVVRELVLAGLSGEDLVRACERIEDAQPAAPARSKAAERQARYRERQASRNVTKRNESVTRDAKEIPPTPPKENTNPPKEKTPKGVQKKGSRIPADFEPNLDFAVEQGLSASQAKTEVDKFRDYWAGVAGAKGVKQDWPATWRNWVRKAVEHLPRTRGSPTHNQSVNEAADELLREMQNGRDRSENQNHQGFAGRIPASVGGGWQDSPRKLSHSG